MSKFYGQVQGNLAKTSATRRGSDYIKTSAQSYDGSVQTELHYDHDGNLIVEIGMCECSGYSGDRVFRGKFDDLKDILANGELYKSIMDELIDLRQQTQGTKDTIQWLYESGVSATTLYEWGFDKDDVDNAIEELESEAN